MKKVLDHSPPPYHIDDKGVPHTQTRHFVVKYDLEPTTQQHNRKQQRHTSIPTSQSNHVL